MSDLRLRINTISFDISQACAVRHTLRHGHHAQRARKDRVRAHEAFVFETGLLAAAVGKVVEVAQVRGLLELDSCGRHAEISEGAAEKISPQGDR